MESLLARCRIDDRVALPGLIGILAVLVIAGIGHRAVTRIGEAYGEAAALRQAHDRERAAQRALLDARRYETDFLLGHDHARLLLSRAAAEVAVNTLDTLTRDVSRQPDLLLLAQRMMEDAHHAIAAIDAMAQQVRVVGLDENQGLSGDLKASADDVEARLQSVIAPSAQVSMLTMRQHEKDFMLRLDADYLADVKAELPGFVTALYAVNVTPDLRRDLIARMTAHQAAFARLAQGMLAQAAAQRSLTGLYGDSEPTWKLADSRFARQADAAEQRAAAMAASVDAELLQSLSVIVVLFAGLCWIVGRSITLPFDGLTRWMSGQASGDLSVRPSCDGLGVRIGRRDGDGECVEGAGAAVELSASFGETASGQPAHPDCATGSASPHGA